MMFLRKKQKQENLKNRTKRLILKERADVDHQNALNHLAMIKQQSKRRSHSA